MESAAATRTLYTLRNRNIVAAAAPAAAAASVDDSDAETTEIQAQDTDLVIHFCRKVYFTFKQVSGLVNTYGDGTIVSDVEKARAFILELLDWKAEAEKEFNQKYVQTRHPHTYYDNFLKNASTSIKALSDANYMLLLAMNGQHEVPQTLAQLRAQVKTSCDKLGDVLKKM